jgi:hypothetical protein
MEYIVELLKSHTNKQSHWSSVSTASHAGGSGSRPREYFAWSHNASVPVPFTLIVGSHRHSDTPLGTREAWGPDLVTGG